MTDLNVSLHDAQMEIFKSEKRFKVASCGRRFGKSYLAAWVLIIKALQSPAKDVFYVAPTFQQAKDILWSILKDVGQDVIKAAHENTATLTLINDRKIYLKGSDRPDTLRGVGLAYVVMDEYASMKPEVWEMILRPTLADVKGGALFIGTPAGKNHFFQLWQDAQLPENKDNWDSFQFNSIDNPFLDPEEIEAAKKSMSTQAFRQEFEATFESFSGGVFKEEWVTYAEDDVFDDDSKGHYVVSVDPAGYEKADKGRGIKSSKLDETAISVVKIVGDEWLVKDIHHGRWGVKETKIIDIASDVKASTVGIEAGALKNAVMPYIEDEMRTRSKWINITDVTHGGKRKQDRIVWALQGRMEHGKIKFRKANWNHDFISQMLDFPSSLSHDDLLDSLAYIDQVSVADFAQSIELEEWEPLDTVSGY